MRASSALRHARGGGVEATCAGSIVFPTPCALFASLRLRVLALILVAGATAGCNRWAIQHRGVSPTAGAGTTLAVPQCVDCARNAGLRFVHNNGHHGPFYYPEMIGGGCGLIDVEGDGWLDLFLTQGAPLPGRAVGRQAERFSDRLYRNNRDGTFTDITRGAGVSGIAGGKKRTASAVR